jgi:hypothetical protein
MRDSYSRIQIRSLLSRFTATEALPFRCSRRS